MDRIDLIGGALCINIHIKITDRFLLFAIVDLVGKSFTQGKYRLHVIVESCEFAESKNASQSERPQPALQTDSDNFMNIPDGIDEELPFN